MALALRLCLRFMGLLNSVLYLRHIFWINSQQPPPNLAEVHGANFSRAHKLAILSITFLPNLAQGVCSRHITHASKLF